LEFGRDFQKFASIVTNFEPAAGAGILSRLLSTQLGGQLPPEIFGLSGVNRGGGVGVGGFLSKAWWREKAPNSKHQAPEKCQIPNSKKRTGGSIQELVAADVRRL
jgi:hypothetical protein